MYLRSFIDIIPEGFYATKKQEYLRPCEMSEKKLLSF